MCSSKITIFWPWYAHIFLFPTRSCTDFVMFRYNWLQYYCKLLAGLPGSNSSTAWIILGTCGALGTEFMTFACGTLWDCVVHPGLIFSFAIQKKNPLKFNIFTFDSIHLSCFGAESKNISNANILKHFILWFGGLISRLKPILILFL